MGCRNWLSEEAATHYSLPRSTLNQGHHSATRGIVLCQSQCYYRDDRVLHLLKILTNVCLYIFCFVCSFLVAMAIVIQSITKMRSQYTYNNFCVFFFSLLQVFCSKKICIAYNSLLHCFFHKRRWEINALNYFIMLQLQFIGLAQDTSDFYSSVVQG